MEDAEKLVLGVDFDLNPVEKSIAKLYSQYEKYSRQLESTNKKVQKSMDASQAVQDTANAIEKESQKLETLNQKLEETEQSIPKIQASLSDALSELDRVGSAQDTSKEIEMYTTRLRNAKVTRSNLKTEILETESALRALNETFASLGGEDSLKKRDADFETLNVRAKELQKIIDDIVTRIAEQRLHAKDFLDTEPSLVATKEIEVELEKVRAKVAEIKSQSSEVNFSKIDIDSITDSAERLAAIKVNNLSQLAGEQYEKVQRLKEAYAELARAKEEWESKGIHSDGLQEDIINTSNELSKETLKLDELNVKVKGAQSKFAYFSSAEKEAADAAEALNNEISGIMQTVDELDFSKIDITDDMSAAEQAAASAFNQASLAYAKLENEHRNLASAVDMLQQKYDAMEDGPVKEQTLAKLTEYKNKLTESTQKLEAQGAKVEAAREKFDGLGEAVYKTGSKAKSSLTKGFSSATSSVEKFIRAAKKITLMSFGVMTVSSLLKKMVTSLKSVVAANKTVSTSLNRIKSNLVVAFQPIIDRVIPWIQQLLSWLERATAAFAVFMNKLTGANISTSVKNAKSTYDTLFNSKNSGTKGQTKQLDKQIKALKKEISDLEKANKALKREYDGQKSSLDKQKKAINGQITEIDKYIKQLKKQESAEKALAKAQKEALEDQIKLLEQQKKVRQEELSAQRKAIREQESAIDKEIKALQKQRDAITKANKEDQKSLAGFDTMQILSGSEDDDPEVQAIDAQIEALEEKKEALQEVADAIPADSDDPFIQQINAQIEALQAQKESIAEVDYSSMIEQQELAKESLQDQINLIDQQADKLREDYEMKLQVNEDAKIKLQDQIDKLEETKSAIEEANETPYSPDPKGVEDYIETIKKQIGHIMILIGAVAAVIGAFTGNVPLIIGGVAAVLAGIGLSLGISVDDIKKKFNEIKKAVEDSDAFQTLKKKAEENIGKIEKSFSSMVDSISDALDTITTLMQGEGDGFVITALREFRDRALEYIGIVSDEYTEKITWITDTLSLAAKAIKAFAEDDFKKGFNLILQIGARFINHFIQVVETFLKKIIHALAVLMTPLSALLKWAFHEEGRDGEQNFDPSQWTNWHWEGMQIPALARGAVIPGGKPWIAMLGDQPAGQTNVEAPLDTIKQALAEVLAESGGEDITVHVSFERSESAFVRYMQPKFEVERKRQSAFAE